MSDLLNFCNEVCRDLPEGYVLSIRLENGSGWVELSDPDGNDVDPEEFNTWEGLQADARKALAFAKGELSHD